jgi:hypothetical protein
MNELLAVIQDRLDRLEAAVRRRPSVGDEDRRLSRPKAAKFLRCCTETIKRRQKSDPKFPKAEVDAHGRFYFRLGDLRAYDEGRS